MIKKYAPIALFWLIIALVALAYLLDPDAGQFSAREKAQIYSLHKALNPKPELTESEKAQRKLGKALFFDPRLSTNGQIACSSCHDPQKSWTDGRKTALGLDSLSRHTLSLWNIKNQRWWYWDGRADSRWLQALKPLEAPAEMGSSRLALYHLINQDEQYATSYKQAFGHSPTYPTDANFPERGCPCEHDAALQQSWNQLDRTAQDFVNQLFVHIGKAIEAFEEEIVSENAPFDQFARALKMGKEEEALLLMDSTEIRGLKVFLKARCILCHHGPDFTDYEFHNIGLPPISNSMDSGRFVGLRQLLADPFNQQSIYADSLAESLTAYSILDSTQIAAFKTPSLRNVSRTAPYMHDGRFGTLQEVLEYYNTLPNAMLPKAGAEQLLIPLFLSDQELRDLEQFLYSLEDADLRFLEE